MNLICCLWATHIQKHYSCFWFQVGLLRTIQNIVNYTFKIQIINNENEWKRMLIKSELRIKMAWNFKLLKDIQYSPPPKTLLSKKVDLKKNIAPLKSQENSELLYTYQNNSLHKNIKRLYTKWKNSCWKKFYIIPHSSQRHIQAITKVDLKDHYRVPNATIQKNPINVKMIVWMSALFLIQ